MDEARRKLLLDIATDHGTPSFVYFAPDIRERVAVLKAHLPARCGIGYAVKANPNHAVLELLGELGVQLDVSSIGEFERGLRVGVAPGDIGFTGPGKRHFELERAVSSGIGEVICESLEEMVELDAVAGEAGVTQSVLLRLNPREVPRAFGLHMGGQPSQFGIDEEDLEDVPCVLAGLAHLKLTGFHAFSAGNSLSEEALADNFRLLAALFTRAAELFDIAPARLVFGSGFGIPYFQGERELDIARTAGDFAAVIDDLTADERFCQTRFGLEIGRWLVGRSGYMLTQVVRSKQSRGRAVRICDAGFNNNLSAAGMMGSVMRRDWRFHNLSADPGAPGEEYMLVGPLCASFDVLGGAVALPHTRSGDVLAVESCGAYGLTASPLAFISHPEPAELWLDWQGGEWVATEVGR